MPCEIRIISFLISFHCQILFLMSLIYLILLSTYFTENFSAFHFRSEREKKKWEKKKRGGKARRFLLRNEQRKKERATRLATSDELLARLATQERRERGKSKILVEFNSSSFYCWISHASVNWSKISAKNLAACCFAWLTCNLLLYLYTFFFKKKSNWLHIIIPFFLFTDFVRFKV